MHRARLASIRRRPVNSASGRTHATQKVPAREKLGWSRPFEQKRVMYSSTFIFAKRQFDDEFHRLDEQIAAAARATPGYLGEEAWENPSNGLVSNVYYWESLEALQVLTKDPRHLATKSKQANWLDGYQVVISQVLKTYGDGKLSKLLPTPSAA